MARELIRQANYRLLSECSTASRRWPLLALLAFSAPILAHSLHSLVVIKRGFRLYNSELWVLFIGDDFSVWRIGILLSMLIEAVLTFGILWIAKSSPMKQRIAWLCCLAFWVYFAFATEVAIK